MTSPVAITPAEKAKASPTSAFQSPKEVVAASGLTPKEKTDVLVQWESDAIALHRATDEGMTVGKRPRLDEVKSAQAQLNRLKLRWPPEIRNRALDAENSTLISTSDARQGVTGHNVRYVLGFGLAGIIGAFVLIGIYFANI